MKGKAPAGQFYFGDWLRDTELQMCSCSTKGIWINLLCHMWFARYKGEIEGSQDEFQKLTGASTKEIELFFTEAKRFKFCDISVTGHNTVTLINRRMSREENERRKARERKRKQRDKQSKNSDVTPDVTRPVTKKSHPLSSSPSSSSSIKKKIIKKKFGELENVDLSNVEYEKLINKFGDKEAHDRIDRLSLYIKSKGDKYKNHYATILNWARKDKEDEKKSGPVARTQAQKSVQDRSALLRSLREEEQKNENRVIAGNPKRISQA